MGSAVEGDSFIFAQETNSKGLSWKKIIYSGRYGPEEKKLENGKAKGKGAKQWKWNIHKFYTILYISCTISPKIA